MTREAYYFYMTVEEIQLCMEALAAAAAFTISCEEDYTKLMTLLERMAEEIAK